MEFSTNVFQNDTAENFFPLSSPVSHMTLQEKNHFLGELLATIDLCTLGSVYFNQLTQYFTICQLDMRHFGRQLCYGSTKTEPSASIVSLPYSGKSITGNAGNIHYGFSEALTRIENSLLSELHALFCKQLSNALEFEQVKKLATKDNLSGLGNRNAFNDACSRFFSRAQRHNATFGILVIDLDNFKQVNDAYGHQEGDNVLMAVANGIETALRGEDEAFRIGGDEFCCLLDCASLGSLKVIASRLSHNMKYAPLLMKHQVSCSIGGTIYHTGDDISSLFSRADKALYRVKATGKNAFMAA